MRKYKVSVLCEVVQTNIWDETEHLYGYGNFLEGNIREIYEYLRKMNAKAKRMANIAQAKYPGAKPHMEYTIAQCK